MISWPLQEWCKKYVKQYSSQENEAVAYIYECCLGDQEEAKIVKT